MRSFLPVVSAILGIFATWVAPDAVARSLAHVHIGTPNRIRRTPTRRNLISVIARAQSFNEKADVRLVSKHGSTLNERGEATGSYAFSPLTITFTTVSGDHGVATLTGYWHGSSLSGSAGVSYYTAGPITRFEGSLTVSGGTGSFAHARSQGLRIKGFVDRHDLNASAQMSGKLYLQGSR